jgi:hypothetical protein
MIENETQEKEDWLNEHGQPDFGYLKSLVNDSSPEALEKLNSIADDLNVERDRDISSEDLIERIRSVTSKNGDDGQSATT